MRWDKFILDGLSYSWLGRAYVAEGSAIAIILEPYIECGTAYMGDFTVRGKTHFNGMSLLRWIGGDTVLWEKL